MTPFDIIEAAFAAVGCLYTACRFVAWFVNNDVDMG
jgi:hypothetical protein